MKSDLDKVYIRDVLSHNMVVSNDKKDIKYCFWKFDKKVEMR